MSKRIINKLFNKNQEINKKEEKKPHPKMPPQCKTCEEQCAGHGGGTTTLDGGCLCFDGTYLECLI